MARVSKTAAIREGLRARIVSGEFEPGDQLPRVVDLMERYDTRSRSAIDAALRALVGEGLLTVIQGRGIYVRRREVVRRDLAGGLRLEHRHAQAGTEPAAGLFEAMTGVPEDVDVEVTYEFTSAEGRVAALLGCAPGGRADVLVRRFVYRVGGRPHQVAASFLPMGEAMRAGLVDPKQERPGRGTIAHLHAVGTEVQAGEITIEARMPSAREREVLEIRDATPVFELWRVLSSRTGWPVEVSKALVPADRVAYVVRVPLGDAQ